MRALVHDIEAARASPMLQQPSGRARGVLLSRSPSPPLRNETAIEDEAINQDDPQTGTASPISCFTKSHKQWHCMQVRL